MEQKKLPKKNESKISELPPSSDKKFWGDADTRLFDTDKAEKFEPLEGHEWKQKGPYIICNSCPLKHSIYIGNEKELVFGKKGFSLRKVVVNAPRKR